MPAERSEEVMKDPHVGGMGMTFTAVFLIFKASALWHLEALWMLPLVMMLSRFNASLAIYLFPYIRKEGMGALAKQEFTKRQLFYASLMVAVAVVIWPGSLMLLLFSLLTLFLIKRFFIKRLGGFSGDIYGFTIEVTELVLLNVLLFGALA